MKIVQAFGAESTKAVRWRKAWESGRRAARRGFSKVSPYADTDGNVHWWFNAGFEGKTVDQAWSKFREEHGEDNGS